MLVVGTVLWRRRGALQRRRLPEPSRGGRAAAILGATLALVEMPTAFPYFAVVAAIVGSGVGPGREAVLLVLYNACFVLPQLLILATLAFAGARAERILGRAREVLQRRWPVILAGFALAAGAFVAALGVTGLLGSGHGRVASFSRRVRHLISH
jgi:cytochrome c biogenesis protein CcdA